jgi:phosphotriesterase-related protein
MLGGSGSVAFRAASRTEEKDGAMRTKAQLTDGQIGYSELGRTLIHEHVLVGMPGWNLDLKAPKFVRSEAMARAVDRLQELRSHDCKTIVDPCPMDLGRDVEFVAEVAQRSGVNIVCATGVYNEAEGIPYTFRSMPRAEIVELYVKEITEGVGETGVKAGVIKIATGHDPASAYEQKMIGVAAEASRLTGVPIISHTNIASHGHEQVDIVEAHGGHANCMVVGHSGDRDDHAYQASIAERGAFVGLDRFGLEMILPDELRMKNLIEMVRAGHRDRILVSQDHPLCLLGRMGPDLAAIAPVWSITHIFEHILPRLADLGLASEDVEAILVQNPRALFANAAAQLGPAH